jgi:hypothetical protein
MINLNAAGTYSVTVTNNAGCSGSAHKTIHINNPMTLQILTNGLSGLCGGGTASLRVGASYPSYNWSTGETTQGISIANGGSYAVTATNSDGCTGIASFTDNNVTCDIPTALSITNILGTSATTNWIQPACYYNFSIRVSLHNANIWTVYTPSPNNHFTFSGLAHNRTYDWQIRTNCNSTQTISSDWTASEIFTTLAGRMEEIQTYNISAFNVYPNPANEVATISFNSENANSYVLKLTDMTGRDVKTEVADAGIGENTYLMNLNGIAKGLYIVEMKMADNYNKVKLVVQ